MTRSLIWIVLTLSACAKAPATETPAPTAPPEQPESAPSEAADTQSSEALEPSPLCDFNANARECLDQRVRWVGTVPDMILPHPHLAGPAEFGRFHGYIEVDGQQYVLVVPEIPTCTDSMEATGILREIDLGGPEGTRNSYRNYYLAKAEVRCIESQ